MSISNMKRSFNKAKVHPALAPLSTPLYQTEEITTSSFFVRLLKHILATRRIDSSRPRYCNSHVILEEILFVCSQIEVGKRRVAKYLPSLVEEAIAIIDNDVLLGTDFSDKKIRLKAILEKIEIKKNPDEKATYIKQMLLGELSFFRKNYLKLVCEKIVTMCFDQRLQLNYDNMDRIRGITYSFLSECIYNGAALKYIHFEVNRLSSLSTRRQVEEFLLKIQGKREYRVYLHIVFPYKIREKFLKLFTHSNIKVHKFPNKKIAMFINPVFLKNFRKTHVILSRNVKAVDPWSALLKFRQELKPQLNFYRLMDASSLVRIFAEGYYSIEKSKKIQRLRYEDVMPYKHLRRERYQSNANETYDLIFRDKSQIEPSEKAKITSSLSNLVSAVEEDQLYNKFLNSWISIEVLFNSLKRDGSGLGEMRTVDCIYKYVPIISAVFLCFQAY